MEKELFKEVVSEIRKSNCLFDVNQALKMIIDNLTRDQALRLDAMIFSRTGAHLLSVRNHYTTKNVYLAARPGPQVIYYKVPDNVEALRERQAHNINSF